MPRIGRRRNAAVLALLGLVLGACSFLSDFPDVVGDDGAGGSPSGTPSSGTTSDGSSSSGNGGDASSASSTSPDASSSSTGGAEGGGGAAGCLLACQTEFDGSALAPSVADPVLDIEITTSAPAEFGSGDTSSIWVTSFVEHVGERLIVGHGNSYAEAPVVTLPNDVMFGAPVNGASITEGIGFVLDAQAESALIVASSCRVGDVGGETFFFSATSVEEGKDGPAVVIGGAFEGDTLHLHAGSTDCGATPAVAANGNEPHPFVAWVHDQEREVATADGRGVIADVAAIPGADTRAVVAVGAYESYGGSEPGVAFGTSFDQPSLYVVALDGPAPSEAATDLQLTPCADENEWVSGQKAAIAVSDGEVWVAGTHCTGSQGDHHQAFVAKLTIDGTTIELPNGNLSLFGPGNQDTRMSITKLVVSGESVFVAGTYTGQPTGITADWITPDGGSADDGFVMRFPRAGWNNTTVPDEFVALRGTDAFGDRGTIDIRDMVATSAGVAVAGRYVSNLSFDQVDGCFVSASLLSRAFFAELDFDLATRWARIEGFANGRASSSARALGTAIAFEGGRFVTATRSHGELKLACSGEGAPEFDVPLARVRIFP